MMVFSERDETETLLNNDDQWGYRVRKQYLKTYNWKLITLAILSGVIPIVLWLTVFHTVNSAPTPSPLLSSSTLPNTDSANSPQSNLQLVPPSSINDQDPNSKFDGVSNYSFGKPFYNYNFSQTEDHLFPFEKVYTEKYGKLLRASPNQKQHPDPSIVTISNVGNTTVYQHVFVLTEETVCPDNFAQKGLLINGQSPGPEIRIKQNSILIVQIINNLSSEVTFHFHGIHQRKSFLSDGVAMVTQKAVPPGGTFTHEIDTWPQVGTFFYHAHTAMDIVWLFGPMIIEDDPNLYQKFPPAYHYDEDRVLILNGVYHESLQQLMERIAGPVHSYPVKTSSITFNGKSFGLWEGENNTLSEHFENTTGYFLTSVKKGKTYRLRVINAASDSLLSCSIQSHSLTVIETDGVYVEPVVTDRLVLTPGQRYSILVKMDQEVSNYKIICKQMESPGPLNGIAILNYEGAPTPGKELLREDRPGQEASLLDPWVVEKLVPNPACNQLDFYNVPQNVDQELVIDVFEAVVGQQHVYLINGHFYEEPTIPYFMQLRQNKNISNTPQVYEIIEGESIQLVFQNQRTGDFCFSHPWHVHGHSFHVVGHGANRYDPLVDGQRIQKDIAEGKKFQFRDSVTVYANQTVGDHTDGAFCGWAAVRFKAKNPGIWLVHCHVTPHMIMGKKLVIWEHPKDDPYLKQLMNAKHRL